MASTSTCPFCGAVVRSDEKTCPQCGGNNPNYTSDTSRKIIHPKTIGELKEYCAERGMPLLRMRFFIGEDYREAKAFGIYQAGESRFVVYKNKADGSRAVRYDGPDEAYAVNELFEKLLSECHNRGIYPDGAPRSSAGVTRSSGGGSSSKSGSTSGKKVFFGILIFMLVVIIANAISNAVSRRTSIRNQINAFTEQPDTYDSKRIDNQYYTYNVATGEIEITSESQNHLNDGYYRPTEEKRKAIPENAVFHRDGTKWCVYYEDEKDWRFVTSPDFQGSDIFLGTEWREEWNVPDIQASPVENGYYYPGDGENVYFRNDNEWFSYNAGLEDWDPADCPLKLGVPADQLEYTGTEPKPADEKYAAVIPYSKSSAYAFKNQSAGYYRQGEDFYCCSSAKGYSYLKKWYAFNNTSKIWKESSKPDSKDAHITFLGSTFLPEWEQEWSVTSFESSALYGSLNSTNGYYKQESTLYYHYKDDWYAYSSYYSDGWKKSSSPAEDDKADVYLGSTYQTEWKDDWNATNFKTSTVWAGIQAEEERAAREAEEAARRDNDRYDSDYDDWDIGDTDWDSDW